MIFIYFSKLLLFLAFSLFYYKYSLGPTIQSSNWIGRTWPVRSIVPTQSLILPHRLILDLTLQLLRVTSAVAARFGWAPTAMSVVVVLSIESPLSAVPSGPYRIASRGRVHSPPTLIHISWLWLPRIYLSPRWLRCSLWISSPLSGCGWWPCDRLPHSASVCPAASMSLSTLRRGRPSSSFSLACILDLELSRSS
jgi:hypothetical protein